MLRKKFMIFLFIIMFTWNSTMHGQFIYLNDAAVKFIVGIGIPVNVKVPSGGSVSWFTNFQVFYKTPNNITYYEPYRIVQKRSLTNTFNRPTVYKALRKYFNSLGISGSECIHRLICEISKRRINRSGNGLLGQVFHILFSPMGDYVQGLEGHKKAQWQGMQNNSDCGLIYSDCTIEENSIFLS